MSAHRRNYDEKHYQCTWEDLEPWIQQLYEDHRVLCDISVCILPGSYAVCPAVVVAAHRVDGVGKRTEVKREWKAIEMRAFGHAERSALQIVSMLLLELENDKAAAEHAQASLWGQV